MTAADLARVDVPLPDLIRHVDEMAALKRERMATGLLAEEHHQCDPVDAAFAQLPCTCKTPLAIDADYPGFADWVAQQQALNETTRRRAS